METVHHFESIAAYNELTGQPTLHPLVSVLDFSRLEVPDPELRRRALRCFSLGFFAVFLKNGRHCDLHYGRNRYDYQEATVVFIAPDEVVRLDCTDITLPPSGYGLLFHPDLLADTPLASILEDYRFFGYDAQEALHLSEEEKAVVLDCFQKIDRESQHPADRHSRTLLVSGIGLFLRYCLRFYERQFCSREVLNARVLDRFGALLQSGLQNGAFREAGLPDIDRFADPLGHSPAYLRDLIRASTGREAQEFLHARLISLAKEKFLDPAKSMSDIAEELGFEYPQHFARFFKKHAGYIPDDYRTTLN